MLQMLQTVALIASITMCVVMLLAVGWLYGGGRDRIFSDDREERVRALTWMMRMMRGVGLLQISVGLLLAAWGSWGNAPVLLLMGTLLLVFGGKFVRFTQSMNNR